MKLFEYVGEYYDEEGFLRVPELPINKLIHLANLCVHDVRVLESSTYTEPEHIIRERILLGRTPEQIKSRYEELAKQIGEYES